MMPVIVGRWLCGSFGKWTLFGLLAVGCLQASPILTFEQFNDGSLLTTQIAGLGFANAEVLTAGISLNEIDFPPHSGSNVVIDSGGPITITFSTPITGFSGYFTYTVPLTITGFDGADKSLTKAVSSFANDTGSSGSPGSSPNEFLQISSSSGLSSVVILGSTLGGSFAMDDISFTTALTTGVPEPSALVFSMVGLMCLFVAKRLRE